MSEIVFPDWFEKLHPQIQHILQYGEQKPFKNIRYIYDLSPDEIRVAATDPRLRGMLIHGDLNDENHVEEQLRLLIRYAAWLWETHTYDKCLDDFSHYRFVRHYGNKAVVMHWNHNKELVHQSLDEFRKSHIDRFIITENFKTGKTERMPLPDVWLKSQRIRRYEYAEFLPGKSPEETPEEILNLWQGWPFRLGCDDDNNYEPEACRLFLNHVRDNLCGGDDEVYFYLMGWMADAIQNPDKTSEVAIVLRGAQGSGKSMFAKCFMDFFYPHVITLNKPDQVTGVFNKHLQDKCVVFADEAFFAGNKQQASTLKTLITDDQIFIHPKGVDGFMAKKCFRMIIASNDEHVIRAEIDDRRYLVLNVDAGENNQNSDYFSPLMAEWHSGGKQALFNWFRGKYWKKMLEYGMWDVHLRPKTKALQEQKNMSLPITQAIVHQMLHDGELPEFFDVNKNGDVFVATRLLAETRRLDPKDETALGNLVRILAGENAQSVRVYLGEGGRRKQYRGYWLPSLVDCRTHWEQFMSRTIEWPAHISTWGVEPSRPENRREPF